MKKTLVAFLIGMTLPATTMADTDTLNPFQNDVSTRIIGGEPANTTDWRFIASIVHKDQPAYLGHFCGGSFLGGKYVLTAAHCVADTNADDIDIVLGLHDQTNESQAQRIAVQNIYTHHAYNSYTTNNDIALIELAHSVDSATIELATPTVLDSVQAGDKLHVAGWGNTSTTGTVFPTVLQQVDLEYVDRATCQNLEEIIPMYQMMAFVLGTSREEKTAVKEIAADHSLSMITASTNCWVWLVGVKGVLNLRPMAFTPTWPTFNKTAG